MNIETEKLKDTDLPFLLRWLGRNNGGDYTASDLPLDPAEAEGWLAARKGQDDRLDCLVYLYFTPVGLAGLTEIDRTDGSAFLYLRLGEVGYNSLRTLSYAALQMLDRAFSALGLQRVRTRLTTESAEICEAFARLGFQREAGQAEMTVTKERFRQQRFLF